jgi:hypothetical protein
MCNLNKGRHLASSSKLQTATFAQQKCDILRAIARHSSKAKWFHFKITNTRLKQLIKCLYKINTHCKIHDD